MDGLAPTVVLTLVGMILGAGAGLLIALGRRSVHRPLRRISRVYVEIFGTACPGTGPTP